MTTIATIAAANKTETTITVGIAPSGSVWRCYRRQGETQAAFEGRANAMYDRLIVHQNRAAVKSGGELPQAGELWEVRRAGRSGDEARIINVQHTITDHEGASHYIIMRVNGSHVTARWPFKPGGYCPRVFVRKVG